MSIAWTIEDRSGNGIVLVVAKHVAGAMWFMSDAQLSARTADIRQEPTPLPLDVLDEMRKLRDERVDEQVDERAQI